jgi:predicted  nucleic acid-binding Zn-ribbon protein
MPDSVETLLRQLLAGQAVQAERLENLSDRIDDAASDARTARELAAKTSTILEEQNIVARFSELRAEVRQTMAETRQDFVAANVKLRNDFDALERRVEALEAERNKLVGMKSLAEWLMKNAPWLLAGIAAFAAGAGWGEKAQ